MILTLCQPGRWIALFFGEITIGNLVLVVPLVGKMVSTAAG